MHQFLPELTHPRLLYTLVAVLLTEMCYVHLRNIQMSVLTLTKYFQQTVKVLITLHNVYLRHACQVTTTLLPQITVIVDAFVKLAHFFLLVQVHLIQYKYMKLTAMVVHVRHFTVAHVTLSIHLLVQNVRQDII